MGSAHVFIDVKAIRFTADADDVCAQFMKHLRRNMVTRAIGAIDHDFQTMQVLFAWESRFAKFDVAIICTRNAFAATQVI